MRTNGIGVIVIGVSAGGMNTLPIILKYLPASYSTPIAIVQHLHPHQSNFHLDFYSMNCKLKVCDALDKSPIIPGVISFAPANYHLLIEDKTTYSLSMDDKVNYSRPSIDILFQTAAEVFGDAALAILLTGANNDGAKGCKCIQDVGGLVIVQSPESAEHSYMPQSAINLINPDYIASPNEIGQFLFSIEDKR